MAAGGAAAHHADPTLSFSRDLSAAAPDGE